MFSERLKQLRIYSGASQKEIAEHLGITPNAYRKYEYGERKPSYDALIKLSDYLNVSVDWLVHGENDLAIGGGGDIEDCDYEIAVRISMLSEESRNDLEKYLSMLESRDAQMCQS